MMGETEKNIERILKMLTKKNIYDSKSKIEKLARTKFKSRLKEIKEATRASYAVRNWDYDDLWMKRRINSSITLLPKVVKLFKDKYKDTCIEEVFLNWCANNTYSYDNYEEDRYLTYGAAIWILDKLRGLDKLGQLYTIFSEYVVDEDGVNVPAVADVTYSEDVINKVVAIIQKRNDDLLLTNMKDRKRAFMDEFTASYRAKKFSDKREAYEAVLSLLPEATLNSATERFKKLSEEFWDVYFYGINKLYARKNKLLSHIERLVEQRKAYRAEQTYEDGYEKNYPPLLLMRNPSAALEATVEDLFDFGEEVCEVFEEYDYNEELIKRYNSTFTEYPFIVMDYEKRDVDEETIKRATDIQVGDIYELCFALLYLADSRDDYIWSYSGGLALVAAVAESVPWGFGEYEDVKEEKQISALASDDFDLYKLNVKGTILLDEEELQEFYQDKETVDIYRNTNLASFVYNNSGMLLPRNMRHDKGLHDKLVEGGVQPDIANRVLDCVNILKAVNNREYWLDFDGVEEKFDEQKKLIESVLSGAEREKALENEVSKLKKELEKSKELVYAAEKICKAEKEKNRTLRKQVEPLSREIADLRELVFNMDCADIQAEEPVSTDIVFPYKVNRKVVVFGGHDSWSRAIKPMIEGARFIYKDATPSSDLIRNADVVWIQTNCLSHGSFWKIVEVAKNNGVPIRYFTNASAEKCAIQIAKEDEEACLS